jgi:hypothetical protein
MVVPFGWYYDHLVRGRIRRVIVERLGGEGAYPCSVEVLPDGLSVDQNGVQLNFPWSEGKSVDDGTAGVAISFRGGKVLVPRRGFVSPEDRAAFLRAVEQRLPLGVAAGTASPN